MRHGHSCFIIHELFSKLYKCLYHNCPRANGAKLRFGRKPGARVTNRAIAKSKVGSSRKGGHYVIFSEVVVERKKTLQKQGKRLRIARKKMNTNLINMK